MDTGYMYDSLNALDVIVTPGSNHGIKGNVTVQFFANFQLAQATTCPISEDIIILHHSSLYRWIHEYV